MKEYQGKFDREEVKEALKTTQMNRVSKNWCIKYLCDGVRLKDLPTSKQNAYIKIQRALKALGVETKVNKSVDEAISK